jgi:hypothetical protein
MGILFISLHDASFMVAAAVKHAVNSLCEKLDS